LPRENNPDEPIKRSNPVRPSNEEENKYTLKTPVKDHTHTHAHTHTFPASQLLQTSTINYSGTKVNRNPAPLFAYSGSENPTERKKNLST